VLGNTSTHKTTAVRAWLDSHPRIGANFTRTSASWLNHVTIWFGILTRHGIGPGSFGAVERLIARMELFTAHWNAESASFLWVKTGDEILAKAASKLRATSESRH
jgi:hypothetical protein